MWAAGGTPSWASSAMASVLALSPCPPQSSKRRSKCILLEPSLHPVMLEALSYCIGANERACLNATWTEDFMLGEGSGRHF